MLGLLTRGLRKAGYISHAHHGSRFSAIFLPQRQFASQLNSVEFHLARKGLFILRCSRMITFSDIEQSRARIHKQIYLSPFAYSETISRTTGSRVFFKLENLQMTGSFKERGALTRLLAARVALHLYFFVAGKLQEAQLGEFCCSSRDRQRDAWHGDATMGNEP